MVLMVLVMVMALVMVLMMVFVVVLVMVVGMVNDKREKLKFPKFSLLLRSISAL